MQKVKCPYCSYEMPITYNYNAVSNGIFVRCKGKNCKRLFEIRMPDNKASDATKVSNQIIKKVIK